MKTAVVRLLALLGVVLILVAALGRSLGVVEMTILGLLTLIAVVLIVRRIPGSSQSRA